MKLPVPRCMSAGREPRVRYRSRAPLNLPTTILPRSVSLTWSKGRRPESNIRILPHDVITVPRAKLVYVIGEVRKSGGFVLREREHMSVLQAISMAEGLTVTAGSRNARIIRPAVDGKPKTELAVNVKNILAGKSPDLPLNPNDILFVPNSAAKNATLRGIESAIQMGTGIVIWHK